MILVKTFTSELRIFQTMKELDDLDGRVNEFIRENKVTRVVSVSDACTTDDSGSTMGIIRVLTYETGG